MADIETLRGDLVRNQLAWYESHRHDWKMLNNVYSWEEYQKRYFNHLEIEIVKSIEALLDANSPWDKNLGTSVK